MSELRLLLAVVPSGTVDLDPSLEVLETGELALVTQRRADTPQVSAEEVREHGMRLQALAERTAAVPFRYPTVVAHESELADLVEQHRASWANDLRRVAGSVELILHLDVSAPEPEATSGRDYLMKRVEAKQAADRAGAQLRDLAGGAVSDVRPLPAKNGPRVALLVRREAVGRVRDLVRAWALDHGVHAACTGPWPAFSFVGEGELDG